MKNNGHSLRERTRQAVQREIVFAAQALFLEIGYEQTTVDAIAAAVGMSRRSVFRYFSTKEDLVLGKFDLLIDDMLAALRERPEAEPVWTSLRRAFDLFVPHVDGHGDRRHIATIQRVIFGSPVLFAAYLERVHRVQTSAEVAILERAARAGVPYAPDDPEPYVIAGAAFACLLGAQRAWLASKDGATFATKIDEAMEMIRPFQDLKASAAPSVQR